jgi:hypothetical protein
MQDAAMEPTDDHPARPASTPAPTTAPAPARNPISPKKLLLSKWTAVTPRHKERHFIGIYSPPPPVVGH